MLKETAVLLGLFGLLVLFGVTGGSRNLPATLRGLTLTPQASFVVLETGRGNLSMVLSPEQGVALRDALNGTEHRRPTTHDLSSALAEKAGVRKLVIYGLQNGTYLGRLYVRDGAVEIRPSDGLVVCAELECPVYVAPGLVGG